MFDSPIKEGAHCAKGASVREHGMHEHSMRLKTPVKLVNGKYHEISWETASTRSAIGCWRSRRNQADSIFWVGRSKHNNEQAFLVRKFVSFWGTNTAITRRVFATRRPTWRPNTWGYGAMTNSYNDMQNTKCAITSAATRPRRTRCRCCTLHAKEPARGMIVVDPRFTRTAAKADEYVRIRSGRTCRSFRHAVSHLQERLGRPSSTSTIASTAWTRSRKR